MRHNLFADEIYHVPDISTIDGAIDLFTFANLIELFQIIHSALGDDDVSILERNAFNFSRHMIRVLISFFFLKYDVLEDDIPIKQPENNVYMRYLVRHISTIHKVLLRMFVADGEQMNYTPALFRQSVLRSFHPYPTFWTIWKEDGSWDMVNTNVKTSYIWEDMVEWKISRKVGSEPSRSSLSLIVICHIDVLLKLPKFIHYGSPGLAWTVTISCMNLIYLIVIKFNWKPREEQLLNFSTKYDCPCKYNNIQQISGMFYASKSRVNNNRASVINKAIT